MSPSSSPNIKDGKKVSDEIRASNQFRTLKSMLFDQSHCPYLFLLTIVLLLLDPNKNPFTFLGYSFRSIIKRRIISRSKCLDLVPFQQSRSKCLDLTRDFRLQGTNEGYVNCKTQSTLRK